MAHPSTDFNLLSESWIPVLWNNGEVNRVSIKRVLAEAGNIRDIAASNPMDRFAVIRFLLALLYWCRGNPPDNFDATSLVAFPTEWFTKLDENKECFNLLGDGKRFFQYKTKDEEAITVNYLIHEIPAGTNMCHFHHVKDEEDGLCLPCCALGLLRLPVFTTQGGQGKSPGINARPPIYGLYSGKTLHDTLLHNLASLPIDRNEGTPAWIKPDTPLPKSGHVPLLLGLTWLPRRVWLYDPTEPVAKCSSCGKTDLLVRHAIFGGLGSTKTDTETGRSWSDPHVLHINIKEKKTDSIIVIPAHFRSALETADAASGQWIGITKSYNLEMPKLNQQAKLKRWMVGFASDQNKYLEATETGIPSLESVENASDDLEQWRKSDALLADHLKNKFRELENAPKRNYTHVASVISNIRPHVENEVSVHIEELLVGGIKDWQEAAKTWDPLLDAVASSLSPGYTTTALEKQQRIREARPSITPPSAAENKSTGLDTQGGEDNEHA